MFITSPAHFIPPSSNSSTLPSLTQTSATHQFVAKIVSAIRRGFLVGGKEVLRVGRNKTASLLRLQTHRKMELSVLISGKSSDALCACAFEGCIIMHISLPSAATWAAWSVSSPPEELAFISSASGFHHLPDHCTTNSYSLWFMPVLSPSYLLPKFPTSLGETVFHCPPVSSSPMRCRGLHHYFPASCKCPLTPSLPCFSCFLNSRQQILNPKYPCSV